MCPAEDRGINEPQKIEVLSNLNPNLCDSTYREKTYLELSKEFREVYPVFWKAVNLIPAMYSRLTLVENISHKAAIARIRQDHEDLPGFSGRNIRRYLPKGNPHVPRRVRTSRPNTSRPKNISKVLLSNTKSRQECPYCPEYKRQLDEITEALEQSSKITTADKLKPEEGVVPKGKQPLVMKAFQKSKKITHLIFGSDGILFDARADDE